jgi:indole-3-glycerol phosphate synthase
MMTPTSSHTPIPAILTTLVNASRARVDTLRRQTSMNDLTERARSRQHRPFREALESAELAIIAEVKMASPSKGVFNDALDPVTQATSYSHGGCAAISVVTEPDYFQGDGAWISSIRHAVPVPVLRKDFIIDPIQVAETAALGADAMLLIARILSAGQVRELATTAYEFGLEVVFEVHDETDISLIEQLEPRLVGVNARDLDSFSVDLERVSRLRAALPSSALLIAESGIERHDQIVQLRQAGYRAFLVGEALLRSDDPAVLLRMLRGEQSA